ncbi:hypothetical protein PAMP_020346 [Pampus punctatissimus]
MTPMHPRITTTPLRSSTRFRHLIDPQPTYYHPGRRYYQDYDNYTFSHSRHQLAATLNKECQFGFPAETVDEPAVLDAALAYHQLDDTNGTVFPPLPVRIKKN